MTASEAESALLEKAMLLGYRTPRLLYVRCGIYPSGLPRLRLVDVQDALRGGKALEVRGASFNDCLAALAALVEAKWAVMSQVSEVMMSG